MHAERDDLAAADVEQVDRALRSFWDGDYAAFDRLLDDGDDSSPGIGALLASVAEGPPLDEPPPARIGDYVILRERGRGGMAVVYEARQEPTGRLVALKVVRRWSPTDDGDVRLFRREVASLSRLRHPSIATLYDAGRTPEGSHYFAMELVNGPPLDEWVERARDDGRPGGVPIRERLAMFRRICRAMHYAHQRGVIHRDLKPANILVSDEVVERGGSNAETPRGTRGPGDQEVRGADDQGIVAPRAASELPTSDFRLPNSNHSAFPKVLDFGLARLVDGDAAGTTTVADQGRIVGTLAYMSPEQAAGRIDEIDIRSDVYSLGVILYELLTGRRPYRVRPEALPESVRNICEASPPRPSTIDRTLRGDLDTIVLKAIEKEPDRRYQSAAALADDIERFLTSQPISARAPSAVYQVRKLVARHRLSSALAAAVFVLAAAFAVVFGVQAAQIARQRDAAETEARRARRVNDFLRRMLSSVDPAYVGPDVSVQGVLDKAALAAEAELSGEPDIRADVHEMLGRSYIALRQLVKAREQLDKALVLRRTLNGAEHPAYAACLHQLGRVALLEGDAARGEVELREAHRIRLAWCGAEHPAVAESLGELGWMQEGNGDYAEAERLYREALSMQRRLLGEHRDVAESLRRLSAMLVNAGRFEEAEPVLDEMMAMLRRLLGPDHFEIARALIKLGELHWNLGRYDEAEAVYREQIRILRRIGGDLFELANAMTDLANVLDYQCEYPEAESLYRDAVDMQRRVIGDRHIHLALNLNEYAVFLRSQGRYFEAEPMSRQVLELWTGDPEAPQPARAYAANNLGTVLFELGRHDEAERLLRQSIDVWRSLFGTQHPALAKPLIGLGRLRQSQGADEEAARLFDEAVAIRRARLGDDHPHTAAAVIHLAEAWHVLGRDGAVAMCAEAVETLRRRWGDRHAAFAWGLCRLAALRRADGDADAAAELWEQAVAVERSLPRESHPNLAECLAGLGALRLERGDPAGTAPLLREALAIQEKRLAEGDRRTRATQGLLDRCRVNENADDAP